MNRLFPPCAERDEKALSIKLFGKRLYGDQAQKCGKSPDFVRNQDFLSCVTNLDIC